MVTPSAGVKVVRSALPVVAAELAASSEVACWVVGIVTSGAGACFGESIEVNMMVDASRYLEQWLYDQWMMPENNKSMCGAGYDLTFEARHLVHDVGGLRMELESMRLERNWRWLPSLLWTRGARVQFLAEMCFWPPAMISASFYATLRGFI